MGHSTSTAATIAGLPSEAPNVSLLMRIDDMSIGSRFRAGHAASVGRQRDSRFVISESRGGGVGVPGSNR